MDPRPRSASTYAQIFRAITEKKNVVIIAGKYRYISNSLVYYR